MDLFKNEFKCEECGGKGYADSMEAIIKRNKLCSKCFCKSLGLEEEIKEVEEKPLFRKIKDLVTKELNSHASLKREPVKKKVKKKEDKGKWRWL